MFIQRHGESEANANKIFSCKIYDPELTETGIKQIQELVPFYQGKNISKIVSSPSLRAKQTAAIISEALKFEYEIDDDLIEVNLGELEGKTYEVSHRLKIFHGIIENWVIGDKQLKFVGGETYYEVKARIDRLLTKYRDRDDVLLVAHNTFFAIMMSDKLKYESTPDLFMRRGGHAEYKNGEWIIY